jgi:hypothetical protein
MIIDNQKPNKRQENENPTYCPIHKSDGEPDVKFYRNELSGKGLHNFIPTICV